MSLYKDATLAMIPTAYKDGKLYSVRPTDGSGDFTFSRGTTATRVASSGYIEKGRENLLLQSNTFDTTWTLNNASVSGGQAGYDGTNDAWELQATSTSSARVQQFESNTGVQSLSIYAKAGTANFLVLEKAGTNGFYVYFDISNGNIGNSSGNIDASITSVGGGWYRCEASGNPSASTKSQFYVCDANGSTAVTNGATIYIQDAQLEAGLVATDYIETTTTSVSAGILEDMPRLDYSGGASCPSLLLEPSRTNMIEHSEYLNGAPFKSRLIVTDNAITSPEWLQNAGKIVATSVSGSHALDYVPSVVASDYSMSIYAKAGELSKFVLITNNRGSNVARGFDVSNGTTFANDLGYGEPTSYSIEAVGNDWYRCTINFAKTSSGGAGMGVYLTNANGEYFFTGNDVDGMYFWGWQLEAGSYVSSYIPTYGSSVTRAKDSAEATGLGNVLGSTEGTIYLEVAALANDLSERRFALSNGTTGNVARVGFTNVDNRILAVLYNGANQCVLTYAGADITQTNKIAFTYAANDFALYVNGQSRSTDASGVTFSAGTLSEIHFNEGDGNGNESYGRFDQVVIFPTRLTDTELASLTTL